MFDIRYSAKQLLYAFFASCVFCQPAFAQAGYERGDVNGDGVVNMVDALYIQQVVDGKRDQDSLVFGAGYANGDVNYDGATNATDARIIMEVCTGARPPLSTAPSSSQRMMYYHDDHLGSTSIVTDRVGEVVQHVTYTPYGDMRDELNLGASVNYLYTGQEFDREIGLYYYGARYYDQALGRFMAADTIIPEPSDSQSYNRYSYCYNNPITYTDPTGHAPAQQPTAPDPEPPPPPPEPEPVAPESAPEVTQVEQPVVPPAETTVSEAGEATDVSQAQTDEQATEDSGSENEDVASSASEEGLTDQQKEVQKYLDMLAESEWAQTPEGQRLLTLLNQKNTDGKIHIVSAPGGRENARGHYDKETGIIEIAPLDRTKRINTLTIRSTLAHEAQHALDHQNGFDGTTFEYERRGYDVGDRVFNSITGRSLRTSDMDVLRNVFPDATNDALQKQYDHYKSIGVIK